MSRRFVPPAIAALAAAGAHALSEAGVRTLGEAGERLYGEGRLEGLRAGHETGVEEGRRAAEMALQPLLVAAEAELTRLRAGADLAASVERLIDQRETDRAEMERMLRETLAASLAVVVPALLETVAGYEAAALIAATLAEREDERLILSAHPDTLATLPDAACSAEFTQRVEQRTDPAAVPGVLRLAWVGGGLLHDPAALLTRVLATIRPADPATSQPREATP